MADIVFLDVDNTLLDFNKSADMAAELAFNANNLSYSAEVFPVFIKINDQFWDKIERKEITREYLHAHRWNTILRELGIAYDGVKLEQAFLQALDVCALPVDGAMELLEYLSKKYVLCSASNAPYKQQLKRHAIAGIDGFFTHKFMSQKLGFDKPDKRFFEECFKQLKGANPSECYMIGDSLYADILGAKNFGMKSIWFNPHGKVADVVKPDFTVSALLDIKGIL